MALEFRGVGFSYGMGDVLTNVDLTAAAGEVTCLLGGSGSGKTTLLHIAAGLLAPSRGDVWLDGTVLASRKNSPPPEKRPVGLLFQEGALFPHMTVADNISYGLRDTTDVATIVGSLLEQVGLPGTENRFPHTLSGGQQQRVALARALAPNPRVLLMDEPFANLDSIRRETLREMTRQVLSARSCIAVLVTHDPAEAMALGDQVAILDQGQIVQYATPNVLYDQPATLEVARLLARGTEVAGTLKNGQVETAFGAWPVAVDGPPGPVRVMVREAPMAVAAPGSARITDIRFAGLSQRLTIEAPDGSTMSLLVDRDAKTERGMAVAVTPGAGALHLFTADGAALTTT